ncbi:EVE domain-containing protein, partial [Bacillus velezensis]|nr:EVE domain-containing protein [Bacillus velezensis]
PVALGPQRALVRIVDVGDGFHLREIAFGAGVGAAMGGREARDRGLQDQSHVERRRRAEVGLGRCVRIAALREHDELADMRVLARGNRLSITPVTRAEWRFITEKLMK